MLAVRPPFEGTTVGEYLTAHLTRPAPMVSEVRADMPADLGAVVAKCLAKDPKERFQTAAALDAALAACVCAAEWSATEAPKWWANASTEDAPNSIALTATFHKPEPTPT